MLPFDDPRWNTLKGGYKGPYDPRPALRQIESHTSVETAWDELWNELHHQGNIGEASYAALPHLVRILTSAPEVDWNPYGLVSTIEIQRHRKTNPPLPDWLSESYHQAWTDVFDSAVRDLKKTTDPLAIRAILGALALAKHQLRLGSYIVESDESEIAELLEQRCAWSNMYSEQGDELGREDSASAVDWQTQKVTGDLPGQLSPSVERRTTMTSREITAVAAKLIAAYLLFSVICAFPLCFSVMYQTLTNKTVVFLVAGIGVVLGLVAVRAVRKFANKLMEGATDTLDLHVTALHIENLLLRCLGLYFAVSSMRDVVSQTISVFHIDPVRYDLTLNYVNLVTAVIVVLMALSLIAKPGKWIWAMRRLQRV